MTPRACLGLFCFLLGVLALPTSGSSAEINVQTPWASTSPFLELCEALLDLPTNAAWRILPEYRSQEHDAEQLMQKVTEYTDSTQLGVVRLALATRYYHPVVLAHRELASSEWEKQANTDSCSPSESFAVIHWLGSEKSLLALSGVDSEENAEEEEGAKLPEFTWYSTFTCDGSRAQEILLLLSEHSEVLTSTWNTAGHLPREHRRGGLIGRVHVMFYANPISPRFFDDWSWIWAHVEDPVTQTTLALRWNDPTTDNAGPTLSGYGVEWSWSEDDTKSSLSANQLAGRIATQVQEDSDAQWDVLSRVNSDLRASVESLESAKEASLGDAKDSWGAINGRLLSDVEQVDIFQLYEILRQEVSLHNVLEHVDVPPRLIDQVMHTQLAAADDSILSRKYLTEEEHALLSAEPQYLPLVGITRPKSVERTSYRFATTETLGLGSFIEAQLDYVNSKLGDSKPFHDVTHLLLLDLSTQQGLRTLLELANRFDFDGNRVQEDVVGVRFALLHNLGCPFPPFEDRMNFEDSRCTPTLTDLFNIAGRVLTPRKYLKFIHMVAPEFVKTGKQKPSVDVMQILTDDVSPGSFRLDQFYKLWFNQEWKQQIIHVHQRLLQQVFPGQIQSGTNYIITNGRVVALPPSLPYFSADAFRALERQERAKLSPLLDVLSKAEYSHVTAVEKEEQFATEIPRFASELFMRVASIIQHRQTTFARRSTVPVASVDTPVRVEWTLPAVSPATRRIASFMAHVEEVMSDSVYSQLTLLPSSEEQVNAALRSHYQFVLPAQNLPVRDAQAISVSWDEASKHTGAQVRLDVPRDWIVSPGSGEQTHSFEVTRLREVAQPEIPPTPESDIVAVEDHLSYSGDHAAPADTHTQE